MRSLHPKRILLISPESWSHIFVSKHHYAVELARRGHYVYFLNPPDPLHYKQLHMAESGIERLRVVNYPGQLKGIRLLPVFLRRGLNRRFLRQLETLAGARMDVVWNFENSRFFDFSFAGNRLKIYHQVDLNQEFHPYIAAKTADIVFAVNEKISQRLCKYNPRVYKIPHGYSVPCFDSEGTLQVEKGEVHFNKAGVRAMYVGNLDSFYLDFSIFKEIIRRNPAVQFYLIGPYKIGNELYNEFQTASNVHFIGKVAHNAIEYFLKKGDILLLLYRADEFPDYLASSHKVLEYFASGKAIVSSYMEEYVEHQDIIVMSENNKQLPSLFETVVKNLSQFNTPELTEKRKAFALENTYNKQLDRIVEKLKDNNLLS